MADFLSHLLTPLDPLYDRHGRSFAEEAIKHGLRAILSDVVRLGRIGFFVKNRCNFRDCIQVAIVVFPPLALCSRVARLIVQWVTQRSSPQLGVIVLKLLLQPHDPLHNIAPVFALGTGIRGLVQIPTQLLLRVQSFKGIEDSLWSPGLLRCALDLGRVEQLLW